MGSWEEYKATVAARTEAINNGASAEQAAQVYQAGNSGKATGSLPTSSSKSSSNNLTGIAQKRATSAAKQLQSQLASGNTSTGAKINALMRSGVSGKEASYLARFNNSYQVLNAINQAGGMDAGTSTSQVSALANGISTINTREKSQKKLTSSTDLTSKKGILGAKNGGLTHEEFVAAQEKEKQKDADLGWFIVDEETGKLRRTTQDDYNKYYANKLEMIAKGNLAGKERVGTGFFDRFGANFSIGFITQEKNNAANDYMNNPSEANRQYLEELTALEQQAMQNNANPLNAEGGVISKDLASWIPQGMNQMKETAVPTLAGIATGNPLITKGAVVYGSTAASFNTMRGAAFSNLTALGYDEETARNAATDEALISAIIEGGETAIDVFAGVGKAAVTALSGKTITKAAAESFTKTLVKEAGKYGLNIASEGFEEALQEIVSIANEMRLADGKGNGGTDELLTYCKKAIPSVLGGENTERVKESFAGGARLGALLGAAETGVGHVATRVSANVQAKPTQQTQTAENIIDNETPITTPTQQTPVQETATTQQATETVQPQQSNTPTLDAIAEKQKSAKSLAEEVINNDTAYAEFVAEYGNPGNTKSEKRNAIASVIEQKRAQNQQTAQTTQTETVVEPQTTVTEQVQATPQTQTTVPPTSPRQNILERIRNTFGNKQTTQTISDNVVTIDSEGEISNGGNTDNLNVDNTDAYKQVQDANVTIANGTKDIGNGYSVKSSINKKSLTATLTLYKDGNIISTFRYNIPLDGNFNMGDSTIDRYIANEIIKHENGETATATPVTETPTAQNPLTQNKVEETVAETTPTENTQNTVAETQTEQTQQFTPQEQTNATQEVKPQENATQTATEQTKAEPTTSTGRKIPRNITTNYKSIEAKQNALRQSATAEQAQTVTEQTTTDSTVPPPSEPVITNEGDREVWGDDTAKTQDRFAETNLDENAYNASGGETEHIVHHDETVNRLADEMIGNDPSKAADDIINLGNNMSTDAELKNGDVIIAASEKLMGEMSADIKTPADAIKLAKLREAYENIKASAARTLRQSGQRIKVPVGSTVSDFSTKNMVGAQVYEGNNTTNVGQIIADNKDGTYKVSYINSSGETTVKNVSANDLKVAESFTPRMNNTAADIISDASLALFGEDSKTKKSVTEEQRTNLVTSVSHFAHRLVGIPDGNTTDLIQLIHDVSKQRKTTGLFSSNDAKIVDSALKSIANLPDGESFLRDLATVQIKSIATDYNKSTFFDVIKGISYLGMLSNPKTAFTNVGANTAFGEMICVVGNNVALPVDLLISAFTGQRQVAFDGGLFSATTWKGASEATLKSFAEVVLDAEADNVKYAYNEIKTSPFKMAGNWFERFLATVTKYQGLALKTTDQMAKGGVEAETKRGLEILNAKNKAKTTDENSNWIDANDVATKEAEYRTLQSDTKVSRALRRVKDFLNDTLHIGNEKTGTYGIGDHFIKFVEVPANQVVTQLEMQPIVGITKTGLETLKLIAYGISNGATSDAIATEYEKTGANKTRKQIIGEQQRTTSTTAGKAITGLGLVGASFWLSSMGILRCVDEEDDDLSAMLKAEGKTGTQINLSALGRITSGDTLPKEGDNWMSLNWIPQLNSLAITGSAIRKSYVDEGKLTPYAIVWASGKGLIDSLADFPAVSSVSSTVKAIKNAKYSGDDRSELSEQELYYEDTKAKLGAFAGNEIGNFVQSIGVPGIVRGIASGIDDTERNTFTSNNPLERARDTIKAGIPKLRETLPERTDNFGNVIKNAGGAQQFLNKTVLPGAITQDKETDLTKFVESMVKTVGDESVVPKNNAPRSVSVKIDGEKTKYSLSLDEQKQWKQTFGTTISGLYTKVMDSKAFASLPAETQKKILNTMESSAIAIANAELQEKIGAEQTSNTTMEWLAGVDKYNDNKDTPALDPSNLAEYTIFDAVYKEAANNKDGNTMQVALEMYDNLSKNSKQVAIKRESSINDLLLWDSSEVPISSYYTIKEGYGDAKAHFKRDSDSSITKAYALATSNISDAEKQKIIDNNLLGLSGTMLKVYSILQKPEYGSFTLSEAAEWLYDADATTNVEKYQADNLAKLGEKSTDRDTKLLANKISLTDEPSEQDVLTLKAKLESEGFDLSDIGTSYNGTLSNLEAAVGLSYSDKFANDKVRSKAYKELAEVLSNYYNDWGKYTYGSEIKYAFGKSATKGYTYNRQNALTPSTSTTTTGTSQKTTPKNALTSSSSRPTSSTSNILKRSPTFVG